MIVIDNGILLESSDKSIKAIAGDMIVSHDRIDSIAKRDKTVKYDAGSEAAVRCLLSSSAASMEFKPLICKESGIISGNYFETVNYRRYLEEEKVTDNGTIKLMNLITNAGIKYTQRNVHIGLTTSLKNPENVENLYMELRPTWVVKQRIQIMTKSKCISTECAAELVERMWNVGYIVLTIADQNWAEWCNSGNAGYKRIVVECNEYTEKEESKSIVEPIVREMFGVEHIVERSV